MGVAETFLDIIQHVKEDKNAEIITYSMHQTSNWLRDIQVRAPVSLYYPKHTEVDQASEKMFSMAAMSRVETWRRE